MMLGVSTLLWTGSILATITLLTCLLFFLVVRLDDAGYVGHTVVTDLNRVPVEYS